MDLQNLDRTLLKSVRVEDPKTGVKTPRVLMSRELGGAFQKGDVLDANATSILIEEISGSGTHGDVKKYCDEQIALIRADMGVANGFATLDAKGNVPLAQLGNVDTEIYVIVSSLPSTGKTNKIYLVKDTTSKKDDNKYYEWAYIDGKWEKIGEIHEDITGYLKKSQSADDVDKGPILSEGTLSYCIGDRITYKVPLFDNSTDNVFGKGSGYLPLTSQSVAVGNGYHLGSGDSYTANGITIADNTAYFKPAELKFNVGTVLDISGLYCKGYGNGKTHFSYDGIELSSYSTKIDKDIILGNNLPCGITWTSYDYKTTYANLFHGEITKTAGLWLELPQYTAEDYNEDKTNPNFSDALLDLNKYCVIFSSGIYLKDKTRNDLLNGGGFTTNIGSTDETTIYHNVAPLIQDTEDETKWYIPAKYMNWDVQIDGESIVDTDTQIANIDYLKKGDQILIKADTDTVHAIVTSGKVDLGDSNTVGTTNQAAIGFSNTLGSGSKSYIFGNENTNSSDNSTVIGSSNTVGTGSENNVFGASNTVKTNTAYSSVIGRNNTANQTQSYIFGEGNTNGSNCAVTIGFNNKNEYAYNNYIFGRNNETVSDINQYIIGYNNKPNGAAVYIGGENTATGGLSNSENTVIGYENTIAGYSGGTVIGIKNNATVNYGTTIVGTENNIYATDQYKYIFGHANTSEKTGSSSISIFGEHNKVNGVNNIALGHYNEVNYDGGIMSNCVAVGYRNTASSTQYSVAIGIGNTIKDTGYDSYHHVCMGYGNSATKGWSYTNVGVSNKLENIAYSQVYGVSNTIKSTSTAIGEYISVFGQSNTITIDKNATDSFLYSTFIGFENKITNPPTNAVVLGNNLTVTNAAEIALGYINNSTSGSTIFSVGNGYYDSTSKTTTRHNLIEANQDGDLYIVEKTNTDGDTTNYYERPMKRLQTWLNEKVDVANIGADDDTTAYTHVCPIVQDTVDTSKWTIPSRYLDATIQDAAYKSEENTFSKTNTFTDGTGNDVIVAANQITVQSETNATMINSSGIINGTKTPKDLFNAAGDYAHIGTSADTADYTNVAPIKETSETYTPAGGTETTETNTIVPMDYMPKQLHVEDKVDEKSTQVVSSKAIYEAIPHIYIHDVVISHGTNTSFYSYLQIYTLDDYDFSTVANIAKWMNSNGYTGSATGHPCIGRTNATACNMFCWYSANGTTLTLLYTTGSNMSAYNCDSQIKISVRKRKLFNE